LATDELHEEVILDHHKSPRNRRALADATGKATGHDPLCGGGQVRGAAQSGYNRAQTLPGGTRMTRMSWILTVATAWTLVGCGDDTTQQPQNDAAAQEDAAAQTDSAPAQTDAAASDTAVAGDGAGGPRNTGVPCTAPTDCTGPNAQCLTEFTGVPVIGTLTFTNGYCSSDCGAGGDCGADGYCVDGSAYGMPAMCMKKCGQAADCREADNYTCSNMFNTFAEMVCFPNLA
jgi:hypothetical protein